MATIDNRYVTALGPIKMEILNLSDVDDADTVTTLIQRPVFAMAVSNQDAQTIAVAINVGISGKTLTLNSTDLAADAVNVLAFGF